ncbi:hypothetical protein AGLY_016871 [Aphis glycines]|uniref:HAT C-terminal dimerisation domain-containing protein n=1 Tax=Aphis glycines TaxID=307491 RepID=A0A6G0SWX3_APHGL|nr:hypothetical protein AGLY_016871 [Aphis glycines]
MISEKQDTFTIFSWLMLWMNDGVSAPQESVCDFSMALLGAITTAFCGVMTVQTYVESCLEILTYKKTANLQLVRIDIAHLIKMISQWKCWKGHNFSNIIDIFEHHALDSEQELFDYSDDIEEEENTSCLDIFFKEIETNIFTSSPTIILSSSEGSQIMANGISVLEKILENYHEHETQICTLQSNLYVLVAAITHNSDHYVTYTKRMNNIWEIHNDLEKDVKRVNRQTLKTMPDDEIRKHCQDLQIILTDGEDKDIDAIDLFEELLILQVMVDNNMTAVQTLKLVKNSLGSFLYVEVALEILLTILIALTGAERSFSKLKLIKNFLRNSLSEFKLAGLALIAIESEIGDILSLENILDTFAAQKARKKNVLI